VPHRLSVVVLVLGLVVTGLLASASRATYVHSEQHLASLDTRLAAMAIAVEPVDLERRLGEAVGVAAQSWDAVGAFRREITPSVGPGRSFVDAGLVLVRGRSVQLLTSLGARPLRAPTSSSGTAFLLRAASTSSLVVTRAVAAGVQRFGFAMSVPSPEGTLVGYAGEALPATRRAVQVSSSSPFAGLDFAIYFGDTTSDAALVESNSTRLPLSGTTSRATVRIGDGSLTLVVAPRGSLAGHGFELLPWGIAIAGLFCSLTIATMVERLTRREELAERLAGENRRLFDEQRNVAETLQQSLLPQALPERHELEVAARYLAGTAGTEVGGDWYDVVEVDERHVVFTVGDVSGKGLEAAALMSMLRNAIKAFASQGDEPALVLERVARMVDIERDGHFATALCGSIDTVTGEVTIANAGHVEPVLIADGHAEVVATEVGPPIGVAEAHYGSTRLSLDEASTLLAFTDGLVERRGELLSDGVQRLEHAAACELPVEALLDEVVSELVPSHAVDDVAVLGIHWQSELPAPRQLPGARHLVAEPT
jgi:serine phosphatase RsbU (regulator of sigma subunit)